MLVKTDKEIRKVGPGEIYSLVDILHAVEDDWKIFMSLIPKDPLNENSERKYNSEDIRKLEEHARDKQEKCAKIMFDEWGTSGQFRPTLRTVQKIALKAEMMRLVDKISIMLGEPLLPRPTQGPGATVTTQVTLLLNEASTAEVISQNNGRNGANDMSTEQVHNVPNWVQLQRSHSADLNLTSQIQLEPHNNNTSPNQLGPANNVPNWDLLTKSRTFSTQQSSSSSNNNNTLPTPLEPNNNNSLNRPGPVNNAPNWARLARSASGSTQQSSESQEFSNEQPNQHG
ncbi:putative uncharacterized protein DDB_G0285119 [Cydia pomonella]|uniref:putative uncharacterized protein DDB_G0285119 n=1 Tax=Cydia pomonella TaxID=82600 RepID=UPI002ADD44AC|nr:putative uncharacterized protein DDB_G0285119 [Cydia pomonella]